MPVGILVHGRRRPRPGARPRARAVALDWGIFSQRFRGEFTQQLHLPANVKYALACQGVPSGLSRAPMPMPDAARQAAIRAGLEGLGISLRKAA